LVGFIEVVGGSDEVYPFYERHSHVDSVASEADLEELPGGCVGSFDRYVDVVTLLARVGGCQSQRGEVCVVEFQALARDVVLEDVGLETEELADADENRKADYEKHDELQN